jgi:stage IV sporulation protein B
MAKGGGSSYSRTVAKISEKERIRLSVGGSTFGVKMMINGVIVAGTTEVSEKGKVYRPAYEGGLREKDIIIKINGENVRSVFDVTSAIEHCDGKSLLFTCKRDEKEINLELKPIYSTESGKYKLGIWVRDNTAGIGTLTFIDTRTDSFGGLGHGIYDIDTGELLPLSRGVVTDVGITGIVKGIKGKPGEIRGYLKQNKRGALLVNCDCGVFGVLAPSPKVDEKDLLPIAYRSEVKNGPATIRCTLDSEGVKEYEVEILNINSESTGTKCFTVHVTDKALIEKTGGIVQGMSGSPIIQDGKLVGAVTHVLVNDPESGYGIFIENMLDKMNSLSD